MTALKDILSIDIEDRDATWEETFLKTLPLAQVRVLQPDPIVGPDHWPYLTVTTDGATDDAANGVLGWLSNRGIGLVINPQKPVPDYVLTYGMVWNFRERGEFFTASPPREAGRFEIAHGQKLFVGPPSPAYLPLYVRSVIKQFFADQGVFTPKVLMVSTDEQNFDLSFSLESLKSPPAHEHANIAEALSWFLPAHYVVSLLSEKVVAGFVAL